MSGDDERLHGDPSADPEEEQQHPTPLSFEKLEEMYDLRADDGAVEQARTLLLFGGLITLICLLPFVPGFAWVGNAPIFRDWRVLLTLIGIGMLIAGIYATKRLRDQSRNDPSPLTIKRQFILLMFQAGAFPSSMLREQFACEVTKEGYRSYRIDFNLEVPNTSYSTLQPILRQVFASMGCADTSEFVEDRSWTMAGWSRGYRFSAYIILKPVSEFYGGA